MKKKKAFELRKKRDELLERFQKQYSYAMQKPQNELNEICREIEKLMDKTCIKVEYHYFDLIDGRYKRIVENGCIIPSEKKKYNDFFKFAYNYRPRLELFISMIHAHSHYLYNVKSNESFKIFSLKCKNQFVDDFVYETSDDEMAVRLGDLQAGKDIYPDDIISNSIHAHSFNRNSTILTKGQKQVIYYEKRGQSRSCEIIGTI